MKNVTRKEGEVGRLSAVLGRSPATRGSVTGSDTRNRRHVARLVFAVEQIATYPGKHSGVSSDYEMAHQPYQRRGSRSSSAYLPGVCSQESELKLAFLKLAPSNGKFSAIRLLTFPTTVHRASEQNYQRAAINGVVPARG